MSTKIITKLNLLKGIDKALGDYSVAALKNKPEENRAFYDYITSSHEIKLEYQMTTLPPKKFFFPQRETVLEYTIDGKAKAKIEAKPQVLFGIRPCDLNALKVLDEAFADGNGDPNYLAKKENGIVIGLDCKKICHKTAFCKKLACHNARGAYDVMLSELDSEKYLVEAVNDKGSAFFAKYFVTEDAKGGEKEAFQKEKEANFAEEKEFKHLAKFPELFAKNSRHPVWDREGARCFSCGSCIMVCPSCYCFDMKDDLALNRKEGKRVRDWDACMLDCFAVVTGGENFRHTATARLHHRINRKFNYLMKKHSQPVCVGCGRCVRACLVDISPKVIAAEITDDKE